MAILGKNVVRIPEQGETQREYCPEHIPEIRTVQTGKGCHLFEVPAREDHGEGPPGR